jgi:hypothetical protein
MSGNIHDTNIFTIKEQVNKMMAHLDKLKAEGEDLSEWESHLQHKYKELYNTSKTLFTYLFKNYTSPDFNSEFFTTTLNMMLSKVSSIQNSAISQEDASAEVGTHLAEKYIPQLKKET